MTNLIQQESFLVEKVSVVVEKTSHKTVSLSGYAIKDKRNNKLINMGDQYFSCFRVKKHAEQCIKDGLFDGFSHFEAASS